MEEVLALAKKVAEEAEVFSISYEDTPVQFEANRLKHLHSRQSSGCALRLIKNGRLGLAATNRLDEKEKLVQMALDVAQFGAEAKFQFPSRMEYPHIETYDPEAEAAPIEDMVHLGQSLIDRVLQVNPDILCEGGVTKHVATVRIINSRGGEVSYKKSVFSVGVEGTLIRGTDMLFVGDGESSCHRLTDITKVAQKTIRQLELAKNTVSGPSGQLPVIFTPQGVTALLMPLVIAYNGRIVLQGASPVGHRRGEQAYSRGLTIYDDATIPFRPASRASDDEGVPARRTSLIEQGVVGDFVYDLQTAGLAGTGSTGSASRGLGSLPSPSFSSIMIEEGDIAFEDMVRDIKDGVVVEQLMGASQGNVLGGEFSGNVLLGYRIQNGELVGRVKNTMVAGNVYEALKEGALLGKVAEWVGGSLHTPHILCPRLGVASKE